MPTLPRILAFLTVLSCANLPGQEQPTPFASDAKAFIEQAEQELAAHSINANRAEWIGSTYITPDTEALAALFGARGTELSVRLAKGAAKFDSLSDLPYDVRRKLNFLKQGLVLPAPDRPGAADELNMISTRLQAQYGKGKGTLKGEPINGSDIEAAMGTITDPALLKEMWTSWNDDVGGPMRDDFTRLVTISNEGARELGFSDVGVLWRSGYDMSAGDFDKEMDRLWIQVKPLYDQLHCYVRARLNKHYGDKIQPATGPIRADLLGNMWAQEWGNIYPIVAPPNSGDVGYNLTSLLTAKGFDAVQLVKMGEKFYTSLGLPPLPGTFWERSQFTKPRDREVICHASAWDIDNVDDLRIKMCIKITDNDFVTIHHELGHNYYQRAYNQQPFLYRGGANDGFHEAVGDFIALSITPEYLVQTGLLDASNVPSPDKDTALLLRQALDKIAFLPFGLLMDKWRWQVFSGAIKPEQYEASWNEMRLKYQGITPPVERPATAFDPGSKYHISASVPYARYFMARILQFQFYRAAAAQSGWKGPLHRCSFYGNKEVGEKLEKMLAMGASRPWPEALEAFTGTRKMDGSALIDYFQQLMKWLQEQNNDRPCGW